MRKGIARPGPIVDLRPVLFVIGVLTAVVGIAMVVPGAFGLALGTPNGPAFMIAAGITSGFGGFVAAANRVPVPQVAPTAGAVKIFRFRVMGIVLADYLFRRFSPHAVSRGIYDGRALDDDVVEGVLAFVVV